MNQLNTINLTNENFNISKALRDIKACGTNILYDLITIISDDSISEELLVFLRFYCKKQDIRSVVTTYDNYLYLDYVNNFLTVARFAEYYDMAEDEASSLINRERYKSNTNNN